MSLKKQTSRRCNSSKLKNEAWKWFSKYVRLKYADVEGNCLCVTCSKKDSWKNMQAGHFIDGRNNSVLFNEDIVYPQCMRCNIFLKGNKIRYVIYMMNKGYSKEQIEEFEDLKTKVSQLKSWEYEEIRNKYKEKVEIILDTNKSL